MVARESYARVAPRGVGVPFPVDAELRAEAYELRRERDREFNRCNLIPLYGGELREAGDMGELVLHAFRHLARLPWEWYRNSPRRNPDFKIGHALVELKTRAGFTEPCPHFTVGMAVEQAEKSTADFFAFAMLDRRSDTLWLLGACTRQQFFYYRIAIPKGTRYEMGAVARVDKYEIAIRHLTPLHAWFRQLKEWRP